MGPAEHGSDTIKRETTETRKILSGSSPHGLRLLYIVRKVLLHYQISGELGKYVHANKKSECYIYYVCCHSIVEAPYGQYV